MRNIPVDTAAPSFVCVSAPRAKVLDQDTGEVKVDKQGRTVYTVGLSAAHESGRVELINVSVPGQTEVALGQIVTPVGLVAFAWAQLRGGDRRWGIAYRAERITPIASPASVPAGPSAAA